jgi:hypothetical protein
LAQLFYEYRTVGVPPQESFSISARGWNSRPKRGVASLAWHAFLDATRARAYNPLRKAATAEEVGNLTSERPASQMAALLGL